MRLFFSLISSLCLANLTLADDTEIYGTDGVDDDNRVNANVLFIMDTSGSMDGTVQISNADYDPSITYNRNEVPTNPLYSDDFYHDITAESNDGHNLSTLEYYSNTHSYTCETERVELATEGRVSGRFYQVRSGRWNSLQDGNNGRIRCDYGYKYWLYSGNYMNWYHNYQEEVVGTRMDAVVNVVNALTRSLTDVNLGLMRFDEDSGGGFIDIAVDDVATTGPLIRAKLNAYDHDGGTPLSETLYEAGLYYRGEDWVYGNNSSPNSSDPASLSDSNTYKTPMEASCQKNHIILLTDGEPTNDTGANGSIQNRIEDAENLPDGLSKSCSGDGGCLDELAWWLQNTDNSETLTSGQAITTYTIGGFELEDGVDLLQRAALFGGGEYFAADNTQDLIFALDSIFLKILDLDTTFTAPAVSVNAFNTSEHRDELFYALFRPADTIKWTGNLKKYKLSADGIVKGVDDQGVISQSSGFFLDSAKDFWNATNKDDGADVSLGGMANLLISTNRTIYTENTSTPLALGNFSSLATQTTLGAEDAAETLILKSWSYGIDAGDADGDNDITEDRFSIGDPLHSEPVIVTYGGTEAAPDSTIYFGTNEGFIHAVDTETGVEEFAFIPQALHQNQKPYFENSIAASSKPYGMDGSISTWFYDKNDDNIILNGSTVQADEHVYLYAGMRRGGRNYYALDVTNRSNPSILFKIEGGVTPGFDKLGQTWSRMQIAKVKLNDETRFVLFFTGGYDINQDSNTTTEADSVGNAVYMVDAETGALLWSASNADADTNLTDMVNSMPASPSLIDSDGDGFIDYLFTADTGGRVFRFDIDQSNTGKSNFAAGGMIASIAGSDVAGNRRFYNKPNISIVKDSQYGDYLTIALGSGHRAHPKNTTLVENRFYVIKDFNPYNKPASYISKDEAATTKTSLSTDEHPSSAKLYNATSFMTGGKTALEGDDDLRSMLNNGGGFYVTLSSGGEKVLSESVTFSGAIIFTTFKPNSTSSSTNTCGANTGEARIYAIDQRAAIPILNLDDDAGEEASALLTHSGIAPRPVVIYREGGGKSIAVGTEAIDDSRFSGGGGGGGGGGDDDATDPECEKNNCYVTPLYWRQNEVHK